MKNIGKDPLYVTIYERYREDILRGKLKKGERLPSLRALANQLGVSVTTVSLAYSQLQMEGYIYPKPNSGYYVEDVGSYLNEEKSENTFDYTDKTEPEGIYDPSSFDFTKWRRCILSAIDDYYPSLLHESEPEGLYMLRSEIASYVHRFRGVNASPGRIVIGAGTGSLTQLLAGILKDMGIRHIALEKPGYKPVSDIFTRTGFAITNVPVMEDGIDVERLPVNISCAAYVSPSNQFPTGAVMPIGKRQSLLSWASANNSLIIEDDYDSELRYFGRPIPAMQGMDDMDRVIYLGSFSATLYPAIKVSYMILPPLPAKAFKAIKGSYTQTCSVIEQTALALFMNKGYYIENIRKQRKLYSQKLKAIVDRLNGTDIRPSNTQSGISLILNTKDPESLTKKARNLGLNMSILPDSTNSVVFYYNSIPLEDIPAVMDELLS